MSTITVRRIILPVLFLFLQIASVHASQWNSNAIRNVIDDRSLDELVSTPYFLDSRAGPIEYKEAENQIWKKYRKKVVGDQERQREMIDREIRYGDKVMRFSFEKRGKPDQNGYPLYIALHGGGSGPKHINDSQWEHMKIYYRDSVENGIYIAPRGVTDTWNLHSVAESYPLYDHLISNMIVFENVDPNRVYVMGFSAGGDGVYQITPRMPDRWAAANMSAGHNNQIRFDNLFNTPFLIQVGSMDDAYDRNKISVENYFQLTSLQNERGGYRHEIFLHAGGSHNSWYDNDSHRGLYPVITNLKEWLKGEQGVTTDKDTNAIYWLKQYQRQPYPSQIYWDYETNAPRDFIAGQKFLSEGNQSLLTKPKNNLYWLSILEGDETKPNLIKASIDKSQNRIHLSQFDRVSRIRILLRNDMVDLSKPIHLDIDGNELPEIEVKPNLQTMTRTLLERGDISYLFHGEIELKKNNDGTWRVI